VSSSSYISSSSYSLLLRLLPFLIFHFLLFSFQPHYGTGNLPGGKGRPARKADNFTAICEPIV
jgi:hypothetical protein